MSSRTSILTIQKQRAGTSAPDKAKLYLIHDGSGTVANYTKLQSLDCDVYGIQDPRLMTSQPWLGGVAEMAKQYAQMIMQKVGPNTSAVVLGGWSFGGLIAVQTAYELQRWKQQSPTAPAATTTIKVQGIILMETVFPSTPQAGDYGDAWPGLADIRNPVIREKVTQSIAQSVHLMDTWMPPLPTPRKLSDDALAVVLLRAKGWESTENENAMRLNGLREQRYLGWEHYDSDFVTTLIEVEGSHLTMFEDQNLPSLTAAIKVSLEYCAQIAQ